MYAKDVERQKGNLYKIKIKIERFEKYDFNVDDLKIDLMLILGLTVPDCIDQNYNKETDIVEFIVESRFKQIRFPDVYNAINRVNLERKGKGIFF